MNPVAQLLVIVAGLLLIGALGEFIFSRTGIPDVIWLVLAGILAGPVFEMVSPQMLEPAVPFFGAIALTIILSGGASHLRLTDVAAAAPRGLLLAFVGFLFSVASIYWYFWALTKLELVKPVTPLSWLIAGAIVGGSVMPTLAGAKMDTRVSHLLEVESSGTDAFSIVMTMVLIDLVVTGSVDLASPFVALVREIGIGVGFGLLVMAVVIPVLPALRDKPHGYTVFLASMLILYALTQLADGSGALAVVTGALLLGNASTIVPKVIPGAHPEAFVMTETARVMQDQMIFLIKSFFFVLIGLNVSHFAKIDCARGARGCRPVVGPHTCGEALDDASRFHQKTDLADYSRHSQGLGGWRAFDLTSPIRHRGRGKSFSRSVCFDCHQYCFVRRRFCRRVPDVK